MSRTRRRIPRVEPLEGKSLLSTAHALPAAILPPVAPPASPPLRGELVGATHAIVQDTALTQTVAMPFDGPAGALGEVHGVLTERINQSAEVVSRGNLVLTNGSGSITLTFGKVDVLQNLTMPYNCQFLTNYTITGATGAFAGKASGKGVLEVTQDVASPVFRLKIDPTTL